MALPAMAIVGTGAVGQSIGRLLHLRGQSIVAVAGRDPGRTARAARFIDPAVEPISIRDVPRRATRVVVATADAAISEVAGALAEAGFTGVVLHTCGARGPEALISLQRRGVACGVLHPLQTIPDREQGVGRLAAIGFGLAGDPGAVAWGRELIKVLDGFEVSIAPERMPLYHASAVLAGNGIIALMDAASRLMQGAGVEAGIAAKALGPLAKTSLENACVMGADAALTGPIARGDAETVRLHTDAMAGAPADIRELYRSASLTALQIARRRGLPALHADAIAAILEAGRTGAEP